MPHLWRPSAFGFVLHAAAHGFMTPTWVQEVTTFEDGVELDVPGRPQAVFTPGHTEGHTSFHLADRGILLAGDALVTLDVLTREKGPRLLPDALNTDSALAGVSMGKLSTVAADTVLPGHGEPWQGDLAAAVELAETAPNEERNVEDLVESFTRGNVTEVKIVLASIVLALAFYQVFLMAIGYGKLRLPFLGAKAASFTHRATGDAIVAITILIAFMCIAYFGIEDGAREAIHAVAGSLLLVVLALKIVIVRWWHAMGRYLPAFGLTVFALFVVTWLTSAGAVLGSQ